MAYREFRALELDMLREMPADLFKEHQSLDCAVDKAYRATPFATDRERIEHLFARYERLNARSLSPPSSPHKIRTKTFGHLPAFQGLGWRH